MRRAHPFLAVGLCLWVFGSRAVAADPDADRITTAVEALTRLQNTDLSQNARLRETVEKLLEKTRGTPNFLRLVQHFKLTGHNAGLLALIERQPPAEVVADAVKLILADNGRDALQNALASTNTASAARIAEALGQAPPQTSMPLLAPLLRDTQRDVAVRKQAVRSLGRSVDGAKALLDLAKADKLPEDLRFTAASELNHARWPEIKAEAAKALPLPAIAGAEMLPPLSVLVRRTGSAANGEKIFFGATVGCGICHKVKGQGVEMGPDLTEIGTKLGKDALYESILDPNAGVSFGYETWLVKLKSGGDAMGVLASETAEEIALKTTGGLVTRYPKSDVAEKRQIKTSMMPAGLQQLMTTSDLVDLVEYLASLRKP